MNSESMTDRLAMAAATVGYFDPLSFGLQIIDGEAHTAAMNDIADDCSEVEVDGAWYWTLQPDARRDALKALAVDDGRHDLLTRIKVDVHAKDSLGRYLIPAMSGDDLQKQADDAHDPALLLATRLAVDSGIENQDQLEQAGRTVMRSMERTEADQVLATVRPEELVGRDDEYELLLEYLRADVPQDPLSVFTISGIGGVGKSALVSTFVHRQRRRPHWPPVVHLDFDRTALTTGFSQTLTTELSHQLGLFDRSLGESMAELRAEFDESAQPDFESGSTLGYAMLSALNNRLATWEYRDRELVIVLDTFEEVVLRGPSVTNSVLEWLQHLRDVAGLGNLRPVIAGRKVPRDLIAAARLTIWHDQALTDLTIDDSIDLLTRLGADRSQSTRAVRVFGGNPLVLRMFNRFRSENEPNEVDQLLMDAEAERAAIGDAYEPGPRGELAVRFLTDRILNRLSDELKAVASPGLVLRRVDRGLIQHVLAGPCGLGDVTDEHADELLRGLASHVWLVRRGVDGDLRHRRDIRRMMLPGILAKEELLAESIHQKAIDYYTTGPGSDSPDSGIEADYHRGFLLDQSLLGGEWVTAAPLLLAAIGADIQDWNASARALLHSHAEQYEVLTDAETDTLSGDDLAKARKVTVEQSLAHGDVTYARGVADRIKIAPGQFDASSLRLDFAQYEFERVVDVGDTAMRWYFDAGIDESKIDVWSDTSLHEHIPWLVALSSLAVGNGSGFRFSEELLTSIQRRHATTDIRPYPTLLALATASIVGDQEAAASLISILGIHDRIPMPQPRTEAQIHLVQLCNNLDGGADVVAAMTVDRLGTLNPIRRPALANMLMSMQFDKDSHALLTEVVDGDQNRKRRAGLAELNDTLRMLRQISVPLQSGASLAGLPTQLTQLHRPGRVLLTDADPDWLMSRLELLSEDLRWPAELTADGAGTQVKRGADSRLMASITETADRLGLLSALLDPTDGASDAVANVARLITRFERRLGQSD